MPNWTIYSLAVFLRGKKIYSSTDSGLRPLWDFLSKYDRSENNLLLHDKVTGLAAARLAVYSGLFAEIHTSLVSKAAKNFLEENRIKLEFSNLVENILNKNQSAVCPGETIALENLAAPVFYAKISAFMAKRFEK